MNPGAILGNLDLAQLLVIAFFIFFFGLVLHLRTEDKREGYPLVDPAGGSDGEGFPPMPAPKTFLLREGGVWVAPHPESERPLAARRAFPFPGSALEPTGDPLADGVGPAAWSAERRDAPLWYAPGLAQVAPLRSAPGWGVAKGDVDPRGLPVVDAYGARAGEVVDLWIDRGVDILRYLEVELDEGLAGGRVLLPIHHTDIRRLQARVSLRAVRAARLGQAPRLAASDVVTALEEDRINAFYAGAAFFERETGRGPPRLLPWERRARERAFRTAPQPGVPEERPA
jgi:photosynthetic reaction center H subunit